MSVFKFLNQQETTVMTEACRSGAQTPSGSYAREVAKIGTIGDPSALSQAERKKLGVVLVNPGIHNPAIETITTRDWARNPDNSIAVVNATITEVLTTQPIDPAVLAERAAAADAAAAALFVSIQDSALITIDSQAETARLKYITPGAGQAMSYQIKAEEAKDCLANYTAANPPAPGVYVLLDSEVGIMTNADDTLTNDAYEVAVVVDATRQAWLSVEAAINRVRVQAKADVKAATQAAQIEATLAAIVWP